jgi:hypothetical protein
MTSLEYAAKLKRIANFLESRPEFALDYETGPYIGFFSKDKFVAAAKALGDATKEFTEGDYAQFKLKSKLEPDVVLSISRDSVCRKVVKFECEPLFSAEEVDAL